MAKSPDNSTSNGDVSRETLLKIGAVLFAVLALLFAAVAWWPLLKIVWEFWT